MRTDFAHLPDVKRRELAHVVELIQQGFAQAIAHRTQDRFRNGKILKIILFGSYARGDWVEDPVGRYFSALVRSLYTPKTHNLNRLRALAEGMEPKLKEVWPASSREEKRAYARLREAYIKARYSREFRISETELEWLETRIGLLKDLVEQACLARLERLEQAA